MWPIYVLCACTQRVRVSATMLPNRRASHTMPILIDRLPSAILLRLFCCCWCCCLRCYCLTTNIDCRLSTQAIIARILFECYRVNEKPQTIDLFNGTVWLRHCPHSLFSGQPHNMSGPNCSYIYSIFRQQWRERKNVHWLRSLNVWFLFSILHSNRRSACCNSRWFGVFV